MSGRLLLVLVIEFVKPIAKQIEDEYEDDEEEEEEADIPAVLCTSYT
jgi:hypothetical protein